VAPAPVKSEATPSGAIVNGEFVFASQQPGESGNGEVRFSGNYGYARPGQLALFRGERIALGGFELRREGGEFGASAVIDGQRIIGRLVGKAGGKVIVLPPPGLDPAKAIVTVEGQRIPHSQEAGAVTFTFEIAQKDGNKHYEITF
jgi:hypothetical protein